jgi:hypothetical protein
MMNNMNNKESYLQRKSDQLQQWERVMDRLIARAKKTEDKKKVQLLDQIEKIKTKQVSQNCRKQSKPYINEDDNPPG